MDLLANKVASKSVLGKKKQLKTKAKKIKNVSNSIELSPKQVIKNKKAKADKSKKKIIKENLENVENENSNQLNKKTENLKKLVKNELQGIKEKKNKDKQLLPQAKKQVNVTVKIEKKRKSNETEIISNKSKKLKKEVKDSKESLDVIPDLQLSLSQVKKGVTAVLKLANDEANSEKSLMADESSPIFLQICCMKIPKTPTRQMRM